MSVLGLSIFVHQPDLNCYVSHTYNVYLFPHALGALDRSFICQVSSVLRIVAHSKQENISLICDKTVFIGVLIHKYVYF